ADATARGVFGVSPMPPGDQRVLAITLGRIRLRVLVLHARRNTQASRFGRRLPGSAYLSVDAEKTRRRDFGATVRNSARCAAHSSVSLFPGTVCDRHDSWRIRAAAGDDSLRLRDARATRRPDRSDN